MEASSLLEQAVSAARAGNLAEAERLCRLALTASPQQVQAIELLAEILTRTGRPAEAADCFRNVIATLRAAISGNTIAHGLHVLRNLGFRPSGILDVGAYRGDWTLMARRFFPDARVLMIEPQPALALRLAATSSQSFGGIEFRNVLLGAENRDSVDFFRLDVADTSGSSVYAEQTSFPRSTLCLPMRRLDDVVAECRHSRYELIKLDVQGAELDVLRGAPETLRSVEAAVLELSILEYNKGAPLFSAVVGAVNDLGFRLFDLYPLNRNRAGALIQVDAVFLRHDSSLWPAPPFF